MIATTETVLQTSAPTSRRKMAVYMPDLSCGGAERLRLRSLPAYIAGGYDVDFVLHQAKGDLLPTVPADVRVISLDCHRTIAALVPLIRYLRRERPHVLMSHLGHNNVIAVLAAKLAGTGVKVIICQHNALGQESARMGHWQHRILPQALKWAAPLADGVVAVSKGVRTDMAALANLPLDRITPIYNPVIDGDFHARAADPVSHPFFGQGVPVFIAVGRLVRQKDLPTLLQAFADYRRRIGDARLLLIGGGPELASLQQSAQTLGIADAVDFLGFRDNPLPWIKAASALVLSSAYEGFGNVLVEALACGTQVVSTDCEFGPAEILDQGRYGRLVPVGDAAAMADAMHQAVASPMDQAVLRQRAAAFTVEAAVAQYLALIRRLDVPQGA